MQTMNSPHLLKPLPIAPMPPPPPQIPARPANSGLGPSLPPVSAIVNLSLRRHFQSHNQPPKILAFPSIPAPIQLRLTSTTCAPNHFFIPQITGKERDTESGNDYFGARYYASSMGRFMSPDWSAKAEPVPYAKLDNPQSLNLYAYVGNNPLSRTDPTGHYVCSGSKDQCAAIQTGLNLAKAAQEKLG